ncbi:MAG: sporulation protein YtxC [Clostridia bacterium]|jgi:putative sporulation protein YtxC|nr:sporulation protein YtxC [Clostridia bacterium]
MFLVTIGAINYAENVKNFIYNQMNNLKQEGFDITCEHYNINDNIFIKCGLKDNLLTRLTDKKTYEEFKYCTSRIITEAILNYWEEKLIRKILKDNYFYLSEKERDVICKNALKLLQEDKGILPGGFYKITRRNKVMRDILDYLATNDTIIIDGIVNFRLHSYIKELSETVERAIEMFIAEREYNEFIKLLKYFVEIQESKVDELHIMPAVEGKYLLLDGSHNKINGEFFEEIRADIREGDINHDDLLISTLITISPRKLYLHNLNSFKNKELVKTITNVFSDRISICPSCEICSSNANVESNNYRI